MPRFFYVYVDSTTSPGPFSAYANSVDPANLLQLYDYSGYFKSLPLSKVTTSPGVYVIIPDNCTQVVMVNEIGDTNVQAVDLVITPTPTTTPTNTSSVTPTPTPTLTSTPTSTSSSAPACDITYTVLPSPTPTNTPTPSPTPVYSGYTITVKDVGSDVVWSGSGTLNLASLTYNQTQTGAGPGFNAQYALFGVGPQPANIDIYSGVTITKPSNFGTSGGGASSFSGEGGYVGIFALGDPVTQPPVLAVPF